MTYSPTGWAKPDPVNFPTAIVDAQVVLGPGVRQPDTFDSLDVADLQDEGRVAIEGIKAVGAKIRLLQDKANHAHIAFEFTDAANNMLLARKEIDVSGWMPQFRAYHLAEGNYAGEQEVLEKLGPMLATALEPEVRLSHPYVGRTLARMIVARFDPH